MMASDIQKTATPEESSNIPGEIKLDAVVSAVDCHPQRDVVATALINGETNIHSYSTEEKSHHLMTLKHHKDSCRGLEFSRSGDQLFTISKDESFAVVDVNQGSCKHRQKKAHDSPLYSLLAVNENIVATGDEDGGLKVWDMRTYRAVMEMSESSEFISSMDIERKKEKILLAACGEGTLTTFDIRKHKMVLQSELFDSELLTVSIIKNGSKAVVGDSEGVVNIFNWNEFSNISDRFPGHPDSVDCMLKATEDILVSGSLDGKIRAFSVLPNRMIGVVGEHSMPVESLSKTHCDNFIVSASHDQTVKFWDMNSVKNQTVSHKKKSKSKGKQKIQSSGGGFFDDLVEKPAEDEDDDDDDDLDKNSEDSDEEWQTDDDDDDDDNADDADNNNDDDESGDDTDDEPIPNKKRKK